jgi:hypothetical protein
MSSTKMVNPASRSTILLNPDLVDKCLGNFLWIQAPESEFDESKSNRPLTLLLQADVHFIKFPLTSYVHEPHMLLKFPILIGDCDTANCLGLGYPTGKVLEFIWIVL